MTGRQVPQDTKYRYPRPEHLRTLYVATVAKDRRVNNYRRHEKDNFPQRPVNNYFHDDRVPLPSPERLLPLPNLNHFVIALLGRYNHRSDAHEPYACDVLYEIPMFAPWSNRCLLGPPRLPLTRGNLVTRITPPSCMTCSRHFSFCTGISMSYRNRYVVVASFSDSLPWHPFRLRHDD